MSARTASRGLALTAVFLCGLAALVRCADGPELFRVVADGIPGGSLLSVTFAGPVYSGRLLAVGGFVGVAPEQIPDGNVGRLLRFDGRVGRTACRTSRVLWWVSATPDGSVAFAGGEGGLVLRYDVAADRCTMLDTSSLRFPDGPPTYWGVLARAANDVWFVGGSASNATKGVLVHYDGVSFRSLREQLPEAARSLNLYKITAIEEPGATFVLVGERGLVVEGTPEQGFRERPVEGLPTTDNRLFTVACAYRSCFAVGGAGRGLLLERTARYDSTLGESVSSWGVSSRGSDLPGLNGVTGVGFVVGVGGFTGHFTPPGNPFRGVYLPPLRPTPATLHAVAGIEGCAAAVGGELDTADVSQRAVLLFRNVSCDPGFEGDWSVDGRTFATTGDLRQSLGGAGQR